MIRCNSCGVEIDEQNKFCPHCGAKREDIIVVEEKAEEKDQQQNQPTSSSNTLGYPMKWHNFLMVVMIIGGIFTIINGITTMAGMEYTKEGLNSSYVYSRFPGLKSADIMYGIAMIIIGIFQFVVRNRLHDFRENGPRMLNILYIVSIIAQLLYIASASSAIGTSLFSSSTAGSLIASVVMLIINSVYYSHRRELFVN